MRTPLGDADLTRIEDAVREAERGTTAEIVVVIAAGPTPDRSALFWPALAALTLPLPLLLLGRHLTASTLYAIELAILALGLALVLLPASRNRLTSATSRRTRARRVARDQFFERGLHRTAARTGVLLYVAPAERCAEIIADAGAAGPLPDEAWHPCLDELLAEARRDRLADGIVGAVTRLGAVLREQAPAGRGDRNELPDRVVLL